MKRRKANHATLQAIRESGLLDTDFLHTYEEVCKYESGVTGGDLDDILGSSKAHAHLNVFRQYGMVERIERRPSKRTGSMGWAYGATDVVPTQPINWSAQKRPEQKPSNGEPNGHVGTRKLWTTIKRRVLNHYAPKLTGIDSKVIEHVLRDIAMDVTILQATIARRVDSAAERMETVQRRQILDACVALGITPPRPGKPIDLARARRQMHRLARIYHPDLNADDPHKIILFERVADAFRVIERYAFNNPFNINTDSERR